MFGDAPAGRPGYHTRIERVAIPDGEDLWIRSLRDRQQFHDPDGQALRLGICSASWPLFGLIWPSSLILAARLSRRSVCPDERVLEIGCGLGIPTLVGRRRGACMTASDRHPLAQRFLEINARLNDVPAVKYRHGQWGEGRDICVRDIGIEPLSARYDLILGSDLLYDRNAPAALADFLDDHAAASAEVWIIDPDRGHRPAFNRHMAGFGFELVEQERLDAVAAPASGQPYKGRLLVYCRG
ncbi:SAM-dependent methyltransferase [Pusillimonas sp. TS35]|uniref:class I SAM-dependent methyltransferase n=1 Tax=Paracandidimonas lactea TaxID=2895524 RepID=UPI0013686FE7|nr:SAM-dependent methyltransferase [Paracandidimonas lactea]MYN12929.1 SAM-dependent methyltransferase [Pusillimonas sp. TS35]